MLFQARYASLIFNVTDLARTERFYRDLLGIALVRRPMGDGYWLHAKLGDTFELDFMAGTPSPGNSPLLVFDLPEGGIADVVAGLSAAGVTIVSPIGPAPEGLGASFRDPDGFGLGLYQANGKPQSLIS